MAEIPKAPRKQNNDRRYPGIRGRRPDHYAARKLGADARQANARTPQAQIAHLDALGLKASKERAKLFARIEAAKHPKAAEPKDRRHAKSKQVTP